MENGQKQDSIPSLKALLEEQVLSGLRDTDALTKLALEKESTLILEDLRNITHVIAAKASSLDQVCKSITYLQSSQLQDFYPGTMLYSDSSANLKILKSSANPVTN